MGFVDVVVPPGVSAGGVMEFESGGASLTATVPDGLGPGDTFQVPVDGASSSDIMQSFMAWFERESVGDKVDAYVVENAHRMAANGFDAGGDYRRRRRRSGATPAGAAPQAAHGAGG